MTQLCHAVVLVSIRKGNFGAKPGHGLEGGLSV
jgi:hypothetical protein